MELTQEVVKVTLEEVRTQLNLEETELCKRCSFGYLVTGNSVFDLLDGLWRIQDTKGVPPFPFQGDNDLIEYFTTEEFAETITETDEPQKTIIETITWWLKAYDILRQDELKIIVG